MSVAVGVRDERCLCGALLARRTPEGLEILCRRCRRKHVIPWADCDEQQPETVWKEVERWLAMSDD
jgi:hypothetical protein